jgi:hypothetical protein
VLQIWIQLYNYTTMVSPIVWCYYFGCRLHGIKVNKINDLVFDVIMVIAICGSSAIIRRRFSTLLQLERFVMKMVVVRSFLLRRVLPSSGPGRSVDIATRYGLHGPEIESRWGRGFPHLSRQVLRPTQPPVQWVPSLARG